MCAIALAFGFWEFGLSDVIAVVFMVFMCFSCWVLNCLGGQFGCYCLIMLIGFAYFLFACVFGIVWVLLWFMFESVCGWVLMCLVCCGYLWVVAYVDWCLWLLGCALYLIVLIRFLVFVMVFCLWIWFGFSGGLLC